MIRNNRFIPALGSALALALAAFGGACTQPPDAANETQQPQQVPPMSPAAANHAPDIMEMRIMAGRFPIMLSQARDILILPEPRTEIGNVTSEDGAKERTELAAAQSSIEAEFLADTAAACAMDNLAPTLRNLACAHQTGAAGSVLKLEIPIGVTPDLAALQQRNDALFGAISPWWTAACAAAPRPKVDEPPPCIME